MVSEVEAVVVLRMGKLPDVRRGALRRVLPGWNQPSHTARAMFLERKLMPVKTRVFIDMLQTALAQVPA